MKKLLFILILFSVAIAKAQTPAHSPAPKVISSNERASNDTIIVKDPTDPSRVTITIKSTKGIV